jgi:hypothetical protein
MSSAHRHGRAGRSVTERQRGLLDLSKLVICKFVRSLPVCASSMLMLNAKVCKGHQFILHLTFTFTV